LAKKFSNHLHLLAEQSLEKRKLLPITFNSSRAKKNGFEYQKPVNSFQKDREVTTLKSKFDSNAPIMHNLLLNRDQKVAKDDSEEKKHNQTQKQRKVKREGSKKKKKLVFVFWHLEPGLGYLFIYLMIRSNIQKFLNR
jgi:hypothetical protein